MTLNALVCGSLMLIQRTSSVPLLVIAVALLCSSCNQQLWPLLVSLPGNAPVWNSTAVYTLYAANCVTYGKCWCHHGVDVGYKLSIRLPLEGEL